MYCRLTDPVHSSVFLRELSFCTVSSAHSTTRHLDGYRPIFTTPTGHHHHHLHQMVCYPPIPTILQRCSLTLHTAVCSPEQHTVNPLL